MADLTGITAVRPTENTQVTKVKYGETIAAGQPVYYSTTDTEYMLTDADASVTAAAAKGVAITPGVNGGYGYIATGGSIILVGTTMTVGETYLVSDVAGGIRPVGDKNTGDYITYLGNAASATQLDLFIRATGNQVP